ncbi:hypothetical protein EB796_007591 [Bugula neritina]|uniref:Uncharacterized protein n=1 Tax=Bugula neritina TaxID=10212 RepID=A0A7J7K908_BUGNE|nr:hypothetical protein EB796_007591 [Bugula neritina]
MENLMMQMIKQMEANTKAVTELLELVAGSDVSDGSFPPDIAVIRALGSSSSSSGNKQESSATPEDFSETPPVYHPQIPKEMDLSKNSTTNKLSSSVVPVEELSSSASLVKAGSGRTNYDKVATLQQQSGDVATIYGAVKKNEDLSSSTLECGSAELLITACVANKFRDHLPKV